MKRILSVGLMMVGWVAGIPSAQAADVTTLRCEYLVNPLGIDVVKPRLSWKIEVRDQNAERALANSGKPGEALTGMAEGNTEVRGQKQTAYQILVASSEVLLQKDQGDLWDSGEVASDQSIHVEYAGKPLGSRQQCFWKVKVWTLTSDLRPPTSSSWSKPASWEMGLLKNDDWKAKWIEGTGSDTRLHYLRKTVKLADKPVAKARLYLTALGLYEMHLNGERVGDSVFAPDWTDYGKRIRYQVYDVTPMLRKSDNVLAGWVAPGWYSGYTGLGFGYYGKVQALLAQMEVTYSDGTSDQIVSDETWKATPSPVLASDMWMGEKYDARLEVMGWNQSGIDDGTWQNAKVRHETPRPLEWQVTEPVRQICEIKATSLTEPKPGCWTFDLGQNMVGYVRLKIPTDCPQRSERLGWMGDAQVFVRTATYNANVAAFFTKWLVDVDDAQRDGAFADVSPGGGGGTPGWADAGVICPWTIYKVYGDTRVLQQHYPAMTRWIEWCRAHSTDLIRDKDRGGDFGDWLSIGADTPKDLIGTAYFAYSTTLVAQAAKALGKTDDAAKYEALFQDIKAAFNKKYVAADGRIAGNTQCCYVMALKFGLLSDEMRTKAAQYLVEDIAAKKDHLSTGFVGVSYLLPVLTQAGKLDTVFKLFLQDTFPSWLFSVKHGATTIWERWDGWTPEKGFQDAGMNSFNHYSLGSCGEWMFSSLAGIDTDGAGFKQLMIRPTPGVGITWVKASYDSISGKIATSWKTEENRFSLDVTLPPNTTATVYVPAKDPDGVTEAGKPATQAKGVKFLRMAQGAAVYAVGSGDYRFLSTLPETGK